MRTFVDASFFAELGKNKLENSKLSERPLSVTGLIDFPPQSEGSMRLSSASFTNTEITTNNISIKVQGQIYNKNTLQEFKQMNKQLFLQTRAAELIDNLDVTDPNLLAQFTLLTFADLKKYKYYYWFIFPKLKVDFDLTILDNSIDIKEIQNVMCEHPTLIANFEGQEPQKTFSLKSSRYAVHCYDDKIPYYLHNLLYLLKLNSRSTVEIICLFPKAPVKYHVDLNSIGNLDDVNGYVRNSLGKLSPKLVDLSALMNPIQLADQAVDLNLKLMKWRVSPDLDLKKISNQKCLLLGAGTLGTYIARGLLAWNVRKITFVDNGKVSYSNPVRQPLFTHEDCKNHGLKAELAALHLKEVYPNVDVNGVNLDVLMAGHPIVNETKQQIEFQKLVDLIEEHDTVFLLMDSREARWLPSLLCKYKQKNVINVALGFDSFVVMRHSNQLGCYFCNDVVAPENSISNQTLDQMCTVTRPGVSMLASGFASELLAQISQHKDQAQAPLDADTCLGPIYHQLRGFLNTHEVIKIHGTRFTNCTACGDAVQREFNEHGFEFVKRAVNDPQYLNEVSGLAQLQQDVENMDLNFD